MPAAVDRVEEQAGPETPSKVDADSPDVEAEDTSEVPSFHHRDSPVVAAGDEVDTAPATMVDTSAVVERLGNSAVEALAEAVE